jgi:hypothetical protein
MEIIECFAKNRFYVPVKKSVKKIVRHHRDEPEVEEGYWIMSVEMIRMPVGRRFIESIVFDLPSGMPHLNRSFGTGLIF